ncbi:MAG: DUF924 domain-containing protein [Parvularculaceae bacterium]|nr:DUF924 domain-containing protein [Parvularculaceae bacterium]
MSAERVKRSPSAAADILRFWFAEAGKKKWFRGGPDFDAEIRARFSDHHAAAAAGLLEPWRTTPAGALALVITLDQFSRNLFRKDARAFAADPYCRLVADGAIRRRFDRAASVEARPFFYLPFMHSERLDDQRRSVALFKAISPASPNIPYAIEHARIIERFGRFPHRNDVLGRTSSPAEIAYLKHGGFRG